jgi:hypothetical protein
MRGRMKKSFRRCAFPALLAFALPAAAAETVTAPREPVEMNWTRRTVLFSHPAHLAALGGAQGENCVFCHHPVEEENPRRSCAVKGCHDDLKSRNTDDARSYYAATHRDVKTRHWSCVSCHTQRVQRAGDEPERVKRLTGCEASACHE